MSKKCKCSPQSLDTLQFFENEHIVIYCTKCKKPIKKKLDPGRKIDKTKHAKLIKDQETAIASSANEVKKLFALGSTVAGSKQQKQLISQINDLLFYRV